MLVVGGGLGVGGVIRLRLTVRLVSVALGLCALVVVGFEKVDRVALGMFVLVIEWIYQILW